MSKQVEDYASFSMRDFIAATAAKTPTPGGGTVAGVVGALATALGEMVLNFTRGKKAFADFAEMHESLAIRLARARGMFLDLMADDAAAYILYTEAARCEGADKSEKMASALAAAINVPREMTALAITVLDDLLKLAENCNKRLYTDLAAAAILAEAVVKLSDYNVRVNAASLSDKRTADEICQASARDCKRAKQRREKIEKIVSEYL